MMMNREEMLAFLRDEIDSEPALVNIYQLYLRNHRWGKEQVGHKDELDGMYIGDFLDRHFTPSQIASILATGVDLVKESVFLFSADTPELVGGYRTAYDAIEDRLDENSWWEDSEEFLEFLNDLYKPVESEENK